MCIRDRVVNAGVVGADEQRHVARHQEAAGGRQAGDELEITDASGNTIAEWETNGQIDAETYKSKLEE